MKAMLARAWSDPETLEYADAPTPRPNPGEVPGMRSSVSFWVSA